jgi:3-phenylpropionate/cinnamic acid dioxygenase small subunit
MGAGTWESYQAITSLMYRYAECIDRADFDGLGRLFERGQIRSSAADPERGMQGAEAIREFYAKTNRVHPGGTLLTRHINTNIIADIDETVGTAAVRSTYLVLQATPDLPFQPIVAGRYEDRFDRRDALWGFVDRLIHVDQIGDLSQHLNLDLESLKERKPI